MKTLLHWMAPAIFSATLAFGAPEQGSTAMPAAKGPSAGVSMRNAARAALQDNIAHYTWDLRVGPGQFDAIRLHRVVKESSPGQPARTVDGVLLLPGGPNYFEAVFMTPLVSRALAWDHSIAIYLAKNDIDVWGMDYRWALVPAATADLTFMKDWGIAKDIQDAATALSIARVMRLFTGQGGAPLHLLGFSWGGVTGYAVAGDETQLPDSRRNLKGLIALDIGVKYEKDSDRAYSCNLVPGEQANLDAGVYSDDSGLFLKQLSGAALNAPRDPSDLIPGLTNYQAALFFGSSNELTGAQFWHFVGGVLDGNGIPSDLRYSKAQVWLDLLMNIPPHFPMQGDLDGDLLACGKTNSPFIEHLGQIAVPILHVGAAGGFGKLGFYSAAQTRSKDVKTVLVQRQADEKRQEDFGHADTVLADDAEMLVWKPILDWIVAHR